MKKGPLSKKEKNYISKNHGKKELSEIASKLNRSEGVVSKYINSISENVAAEQEPTPETEVENPPQQPRVHDVSNLFAKNKERGVVVMTEAAASASDDNKKTKAAHQSPPRYHRHIHRIKD